MKRYGYFYYEINEALYLSSSEEEIMWELYRKIEIEYFNNQNEFSKQVILTHISSILKYAQRFYKRQFVNREESSCELLTKFEKALAEYFRTSTKAQLNQCTLQAEDFRQSTEMHSRACLILKPKISRRTRAQISGFH